MGTERIGQLTVTANAEKVVTVDLTSGTTIRLNSLTITRSRPSASKAGHQMVTLVLTSGSYVNVVGISGKFKFKELVINVDTGKMWAEVVGGSKNHMRSVPVEKLIPPTWAVRPRAFEYGIHDENSSANGND